MNPFQDLVPNQENQPNPFADLIPQQKTSTTQKLLNAGTAVTNFLGGKSVQETLGSELAKLKATPQEKQFISESQPKLGQTVGSAAQLASTFLPVGGIASGITSAARSLGLKKGVSAIGKIGSGALVGSVFDVGENLQNQKTGVGVLKPSFGTALGAGIPAVGVGINASKRVGNVVLPKLLSYTSDVPEKAFTTMLQRRTPVVKAIEAGASPESALKNTQVAVRALRSDLTNEWQSSVKNIADEFSGKRLGLSEKSIQKATGLAEDFGFTLPQNPKNASVVEWLNTIKSVNELPKLTLTVSPKGNTVRAFKKDLQGLVLKTFGGEKGSVGTLYKNYATKKGIFDAANDIVKAYSTGKPIQQSTALNRLQTLFNENKPAYLDAILDLEKATGRDLLSEITASKFANKLPTGGSPVSATSGILAPTGIVDKAIKLLLLPLSSPRSAAFIARAMTKGTQLGAIRGPGDVIAKTQLGQKIENDLKSYAKNPKLGMSIQAVDDLGNPIKTNVDDITSSIQKAKTSGQSFDEWVEGQTDFNHASAGEIKEFLPDFPNQKPVFLTKDKNYYIEHIGKNAKNTPVKVNLGKTITLNDDLIKEALDTSDYLAVERFNLSRTKEREKVFNWLKEKGYDSAIIPKDWLRGDDFRESLVVFNPSKQIKTRSQLKAEWDKVK